MKLQKLFSLLSLSLLIPQGLVHASHYPLSYESQQSVKNASLIGGLVGGALGLAAGCYKQSQDPATQNKTMWEKIKSFPWHYAIIPAVIGAVGSGLISYYYVPEKYLESAEKQLNSIEHDVIFNTAIGSNEVSDLKKLAFDSQYPTLKSYGQVESLLSKIRSIKDYLITVINSGINPLVNIAQAALAKIKSAEEKLISMMIKLKTDGSYHQELVTRNTINHMQEVAFQQGRMAAAAESQARAAWHSAHNAPQVVVRTANSPDIVIVKR